MCVHVRVHACMCACVCVYACMRAMLACVCACVCACVRVTGSRGASEYFAEAELYVVGVQYENILAYGKH